MHVGLVTRSQTDYAIDLANGLDAQGNVVTVYLDYAQVLEEIGTSEQPIELIYKVGLLPSTCRVRLLHAPRMRDPRSFVFFKKLARTMYEDGVDVIHVLLNPGEIWFAMLPLFLKELPVVTTIIVPVANSGERLPTPVVWGVNKIAICGSDIAIVNGENQVELVNRIYGIPYERISYIPLSLYGRALKWRRNPIPEEPGTILFFGRAHPQKGLEYLIKAQPLITQKVPHARFLISAHGKDLQRCRKMIDDQGKFEIIEGVVPANVMADLFQRSSLVALPYISASTSGVLVTAYSFAKPVVASRVGCLAEYVDDGVSGFLVNPTDVESLAKAIIRLLMNDNLRHKMGSNAEKWVMKMDESSIGQTIDIYKRAKANHSKKTTSNWKNHQTYE